MKTPSPIFDTVANLRAQSNSVREEDEFEYLDYEENGYDEEDIPYLPDSEIDNGIERTLSHYHGDRVDRANSTH